MDVLVVGGGPAGLGAAKELAALGLSVAIADDKESLGGKLVLQTHKFFGSEADCYAGTRGFDIARKLEAELRADPRVAIFRIPPSSGSSRTERRASTRTARPISSSISRPSSWRRARARRSIVFPGNDLPGVYGAGAFQTLVNRDRVKAADRVLIVGSGNVGLIGAYHALQAGIEVAGIVEIADRIDGYKVHADKIVRMGVPICLSTTIVSAEGEGRVERATVARVGKRLEAPARHGADLRGGHRPRRHGTIALRRALPAGEVLRHPRREGGRRRRDRRGVERPLRRPHRRLRPGARMWKEGRDRRVPG